MGARVYLLVREQRRRMIADSNNQLIFVLRIMCLFYIKIIS